MNGTHHQHRRIDGLGSSIAINSVFLVANTFAGSLLGFMFWVLAARLMSPAQVGIGAAYFGAVTMLAGLGDMGLGTTLIRFAPEMGTEQVDFANSSLTVVSGITLVLAIVFLIGIPLWSPELNGLTGSALNMVLFVCTAVVFSAAQLGDRLYIAFQVAHYLFVRNMVAGLLRVGLLVFLAARLGALGIMLALGVGALTTFGLSVLVLMPRTVSNYRWRLNVAWTLVLEKARYALSNHLSLFLWNMPPLVYPLIVIRLLGPQANAYFYASWMLANLFFMVPTAIATSAFAVTADDADMNERAFWHAMRVTILGLVPLTLILVALSRLLLSLFGEAYAAGAQSLLVLLVLSLIPYNINTFAITYRRISQDVRGLLYLCGTIAGLSLVLVALGGAAFGLTGTGAGWILAHLVGTAITLSDQRFRWRRRSSSS